MFLLVGRAKEAPKGPTSLYSDLKKIDGFSPHTQPETTSVMHGSKQTGKSEAESGQSCLYVRVRNIPSEFTYANPDTPTWSSIKSYSYLSFLARRIADLRFFFSDYIESNKFIIFHYCRRPEEIKRGMFAVPVAERATSMRILSLCLTSFQEMVR